MKINVFGMGYVGCVSAACLAVDGNDVTGIDVDREKIKAINDGRSPIVEPELEERIKRAVGSGKLRATVDDIVQADVSVVCVGTPSNENGSLQLKYITKVAEQIGDYLKKIDTYHVVNIRSTVLPGTTEETIIPIINQRSMKRAGEDFGVCMNPEFIREGTSVSDYYNPPFTLIGGLDGRSEDVVAQMYHNVNAPVIRTKIKVAEMVKYVCNSFHGLKVSFANEIGNICKRVMVDSHEVMDVMCRDTKLNLSSYYMKPGFAFGGSCLPKDLRALLFKARQLDLDSPLLAAILQSNQNQINMAYELIKKSEKKKVGVLGLSFKPETDDLRESPIVELIEMLIGKGYEVSIYDREVSLSRIFGSNRGFIERAIPHVASLLKPTMEDVFAEAQVIVVAKNSKEFRDAIARLRGDKTILDLVRVIENVEREDVHYEGICW